MKRFIGSVLASFVILGAFYLTTIAQPASAVTSAALSIVPNKNYVVESGKSVEDTLLVRNLDSTAPLELSLRVVDFTFTDDGGTPKLMLGEDAPQTTWSLKPFLSIPETVTVPPGGSKSIDMKIAVPAGHGAGSYYSAIIYSTGTPSKGNNVGLSASGATLVFTSIPGDVDEDVKLKKLGAYHVRTATEEAGYDFITTKKPKIIAYTVKNSGNVTESLAGSITLTDLFGRKTVIKDINPQESLALIGQTRTFKPCVKLNAESADFEGDSNEAKNCTESDLWPGYYSVTLDAFYGKNGNETQRINGDASFLYLPWWFIALLLVVIIAATYITWRIVRKVRSKQRRSKRKK